MGGGASVRGTSARRPRSVGTDMVKEALNRSSVEAYGDHRPPRVADGTAEGVDPVDPSQPFRPRNAVLPCALAGRGPRRLAGSPEPSPAAPAGAGPFEGTTCARHAAFGARTPWSRTSGSLGGGTNPDRR